MYPEYMFYRSSSSSSGGSSATERMVVKAIALLHYHKFLDFCGFERAFNRFGGLDFISIARSEALQRPRD